MGKTSVNTACMPRFLRLDCARSAWRNSLYDLVCSSMRFGGAIISLILPKLIRSVARDGIWTFSAVRFLKPDGFLFNDTRQGRDVQSRTCQHPNPEGFPEFRCFCNFY